MSLSFLSDHSVQSFIKSALSEDVGDGDHSSLAAIPADKNSRARLIIKDEGVIAGVALAQKIFRQFDPTLSVTVHKHDGEPMYFGEIAFEVEGSARSILTTERLVLNCMQRMSGIATYTSHLVSLLKNTRVVLLDTRKTTPNFRLPEKWAVAIGGGKNHRFGLFDMVMLKDNHIDFAGGITKAVTAAKSYLQKISKPLPIEVETRNLEEVREALHAGADVIMLDNMMPSVMREAVRLIDGKSKIEASGGITEMNIAEVAECGIDFISVGALTHSIKSKDLSLKAF